MLHDAVRESYIFREVLQEERDKGRLEDLSKSIIGFVHARYPALEELAEKQVDSCEDIERLDQLRTNLYMARSAKKVKQHLLAMGKDSVGEV
jgi:CMP-2-keto-3-deoxyoctulosonic acid synthetase